MFLQEKCIKQFSGRVTGIRNRIDTGRSPAPVITSHQMP